MNIPTQQDLKRLSEMTRCGGSGRIALHDDEWLDCPGCEDCRCPDCEGTGWPLQGQKYKYFPCPTCHGTGRKVNNGS